VSGEEAGEDSGERGDSAGFIYINVGGLIEQDGIAGFGVGADGDLIRHGAGGDVDGVFYTEERGYFGFQFFHCGVVTIDIIADGGAGHGFAHGFGGLAASVAAEIDHALSP